MKKSIVILISLVFCLFLIGCGEKTKAEDITEDSNVIADNSGENNDADIKIEDSDKLDENDSDSNESSEVDETNKDEDNSEDENSEQVDENSNLPKSKLNGFPYEEDELSKRVICISIDNHPKARPQAGLSLAEIIYEFEVEGPYTRYMGVFQIEEPKRIGPVRSARPYLIESALSYDALFCHCGGSNDAFKMLSNLAVANIDGLYTSSYWRYNSTGKYAPHNLYTTIPMLRDYAKRANYRSEADFEGFDFNDKDMNLSDDDDQATIISIDYNKENNTTYEFEENLKKYARFKDGKIDYDENTGVQLFAKNIIVVKVNKTVLDDEGRLALTVVGNGKGYYFTNNKKIDITWEKTTSKSELKLYDGETELKLNPGSTWIQVISAKTEIDVDEVNIDE